MSVSASYALVSPSAATPPAAQVSSSPLEPAPPPAAKEGIVRPFRLGANGNPVTASGEALRASRIEQVLSTRSSGGLFSGELLWLMRFGSQYELLLQTNLTDERAPLAVIYGQDALARALPSEVVERADVIVDDEAEHLEVVLYTRERAARGAPRTVRPATTARVKVK